MNNIKELEQELDKWQKMYHIMLESHRGWEMKYNNKDTEVKRLEQKINRLEKELRAINERKDT